MYKGKKILAIIPARGGSKGIPDKNMQLVAGLPLICHTIETAKKSTFIDTTIVSTDDNRIAYIAQTSGMRVPFRRPKKYAQDSSPTSEVILHAIQWYERNNKIFDIVVLLEPTSPLRKDDDIDNAIQSFIESYGKADTMVSVGEIQLENPYISKIIDQGFVRTLIPKPKAYSQRQQLPKTYFPYGVVYISKIETYKKYKTFYQNRTIPYMIERWQNYEIDDIYDLYSVEAIMLQKYLVEQRSLGKKQFPLLAGKSIQLRQFTDEHLFDPKYMQWLKDRDVIKTIGRNEYFQPIAFSAIMAYVRSLQESPHHMFFALHLIKTGEFIGTAKIGSIDRINKTADIGIMIGDKRCWGKGFATEAICLLCSFAFGTLHVRKLTGGCMKENPAMMKCFEKAGFMKEGIQKEQNFFENRYSDHIMYGLFSNTLASQKP